MPVVETMPNGTAKPKAGAAWSTSPVDAAAAPTRTVRRAGSTRTPFIIERSITRPSSTPPKSGPVVPAAADRHRQACCRDRNLPQRSRRRRRRSAQSTAAACRSCRCRACEPRRSPGCVPADQRAAKGLRELGDGIVVHGVLPCRHWPRRHGHQLSEIPVAKGQRVLKATSTARRLSVEIEWRIKQTRGAGRESHVYEARG